MHAILVRPRKSESELDVQWHPDRVFEPQMSASQRSLVEERWQRAVNRPRQWAG